MGQFVFGLSSVIGAGTLWLGIIFDVFDPLTTIVMAVIGLKRSLLSNTPCLSNLYLFKCLKKIQV